MALFEPVFKALDAAAVRYVVVGGLATVLHGYARLTADVDLCLDLGTENVRRAVVALTGLGLQPRSPVDPMAFVDEQVRASWFADKGMRVFSLWDPTNPMLEVDVFVENPIEFELLFERSQIIQLATTTVRIASIEDLIQLKRLANRPQDQQDIAALQAIRRAKLRDE